QDNGESASLKNITFAGVPKVGTKVGSGPHVCWGQTDSHTYRADVTAEVTGNGTYSLTGVASGGGILAQGAQLRVLYKAAAAPLRDIVVYNGNDVVNASGQIMSGLFPGFDALGGTDSARTTFVVGDGQAGSGFDENVRFSSKGGNLGLPNIFTGSDGNYWDTKTVDVSAQVTAGAAPANITLGIPDNGGGVFFSGAPPRPSPPPRPTAPRPA